MKDPLLRLNAVSVGYTSNTLFENLNLSLYPGDFICFMGPNGVGKSTLIRAISGLDIPLAGEVTIAGKHSGADTVAVVLTDRITPQNMTVYELVSLGRYPYLNWRIRFSNHDQMVVSRAIDQVNIRDLQHRSVDELSDGQLQLVMIARALAQDTPLLILDEPTAHLDLNNRLEIMKLLKRVARQHQKGVLVSTHDLDLALQTADRVWLCGTQKNIISGFPEDLVMRNAFDAIFQLKGFDLKTGTVTHEDLHGRSIGLEGNGYAFLWTKNALERNGFAIDAASSITVNIRQQQNQFLWTVGQLEFVSLEDLINWLLLKNH